VPDGTYVDVRSLLATLIEWRSRTRAAGSLLVAGNTGAARRGMPRRTLHVRRAPTAARVAQNRLFESEFRATLVGALCGLCSSRFPGGNFDSEGREAADMATARSKTARTRVGAPANAESSPWTGALRFEVYEENSGRHRWRLTSSDGSDLATSSASFATHDEAQRAVTANRD
jgi:uncharacterized protein YegP (UPF0339 family)